MDGHRGAGADLELVGGELPETLGGVDVGPGEGAVELGRVDVAELVGADGVLAEIGCEDRHGEAGHGVVEEGLLLSGLDGVEFGVSETDESVGVGVCHEGLRDCGCHLDGLVVD